MIEYKNETEFRRDVMKDLQSLGFLVYAIPNSRRQLGDAGYPDVTAARAGKVVWIECKMPDEGLTDVQWQWREELYDRANHEQTCFMVWPDTWQATLEAIVG